MSNFDSTTGNEIVNIGSGAVTITVPGTVTLLPPEVTYAAPDHSSIANAGTAVAVFGTLEINTGAVIQNLLSNTATLIVNGVTTAGTVAGGTNFGLAPGMSFNFGPSTNAISANSTAAISFSAMRW